MEALPVELLRLIFEFCDGPTVRKLRLVSKVLAEIGYDYFLPAHFTSVAARDNIKSLHSIACHERLQSVISTITFNLSHVNSWPPSNSVSNAESCTRDELEARAKMQPEFHTRSALLEEIFQKLPNLENVEVTALGVDLGRAADRSKLCKDMNAIVAAFPYAQLSTLVIDRLPLEIFQIRDDRKLWFDSCARSLSSLTRLDITIDAPGGLLPASLFRSTNSVGYVLQCARNLTNLSLRFRRGPRKFNLSFHDLLGDFTWNKLTDLTLEGVCCAEKDLYSFLVRHGATLTRLRLGGRGHFLPSRSTRHSMGGIHLCEGSFRSLFLTLRGRLPRLERFHMEGDFHAGAWSTMFQAVTNDDWTGVDTNEHRTAMDQDQTRRNQKMLNSVELERFLVHGGRYPRLAVSA